MNETESLLVLNAVKGIGNAGIRKLLNHYGSASNVLAASKSDLLGHSALSEQFIKNICSFPKSNFLENEYRLMAKHQVYALSAADPTYPKALQSIPDAPVVLYVKGNLPIDEPLALAVVGSRKASLYGVHTAEAFASQLAELDFVIVSGLARGIDTAAHNGALRAHGSTIAVLGCGLGHVYPRENRSLCEKIAESGAVISEFPMGTMPAPYNFPRRNRIISGLSVGVLVVEAAMRSGALITADYALEQGREVYAVPGKIDQDTAGGVNNLIKQGAKLVTSVDDILEDLRSNIKAALSKERMPSHAALAPNRLDELTQDERQVLEHVSDRPVHIDELAECCGSTIPVMSVLLQLELKQLIKQLPGKLFVR